MLKNKEINLIGKTVKYKENRTNKYYCPEHFTQDIQYVDSRNRYDRYSPTYKCGVVGCTHSLQYIEIEYNIKILKRYDKKYLCYIQFYIDERIKTNIDLSPKYILYDDDWLLNAYVQSLNEKHLNK